MLQTFLGTQDNFSDPISIRTPWENCCQPTARYHLSTVELAFKAVLWTRLGSNEASKNTFVRTEVWPLCHTDGSQYGQNSCPWLPPLMNLYSQHTSDFLAAKPPALTRVHNDILLETDNRHCVKLLLPAWPVCCLTRFSVRGTALDWFRSYLTTAHNSP